MKQCLLPNGKKKIWYELENLLSKLNLVLLERAKLRMRFFCTQITSKAIVFIVKLKTTSMKEIRQNPGFL